MLIECLRGFGDRDLWGEIFVLCDPGVATLATHGHRAKIIIMDDFKIN